MPTKRLDPEALAVETFATTPAMAAQDSAADLKRRSLATSCPNPPPYCTC
ncbi:MAG TPA: hypothetical protein VF771_00895 [Longimicrobiaceae bacterium]